MSYPRYCLNETQDKLILVLDNGTIIRLRGRGGPGDAGAPDGDLLVQVAVDPHKLFKRNNSDLILEVPLLFTEAALGASVKIPTLKKSVTLKIPAGTPSGFEGKRFSLPNSTIMLHSVGTQLGGQYHDLEKEMEETKRKQKVISEILSKHLKKKIDQITADIQRNFYQTAEEALKYGLIDTIISNKEDKNGN